MYLFEKLNGFEAERLLYVRGSGWGIMISE